jgi:predicted nucleotidyltransferase
MFPKMFIFVIVEEQSENIDSIVKHWKESSDQNYLTMQNLLKSKDMVNPAIIETARKYVSQIPHDLGLKRVYLFGSYAQGLEHEESDIDIALVLGNMTNFFSTQMLLMRLRRKVDLRIEPHPIYEKDFNSMNPFACEIQKYGIEIPTNKKTP